jgi:hypothetical protein
MLNRPAQNSFLLKSLPVVRSKETRQPESVQQKLQS